jgi:hypothetical protein
MNQQKTKSTLLSLLALGLTASALAQRPDGQPNDGPKGGSNMTIYIVVGVIVLIAVVVFVVRSNKK